MHDRSGSLLNEVAVVRAFWKKRLAAAEITLYTSRRYERVLTSFARYAGASNCLSFSAASEHLCNSFICAPRPGGRHAAVATSRFRLAVLRDVYSALQDAGVGGLDPTASLRIDRASKVRQSVPLTPNEVSRLRQSGRTRPGDYMRPAIVELALLGGAHVEIADAMAADVELERNEITLGWRLMSLDSVAVSALGGRITECQRASHRAGGTWDPAMAPLALRVPRSFYAATTSAPSISYNLGRSLTSAGISRPGVRPLSVRDYAVNRVYARSGIEAAAEFMGFDSLDLTRSFICMSWQEQFNEEVGAHSNA